MIERLRDKELPVLIRGETGTGKELVARAIHEAGPRCGGRFFALHCGSLPAELFESELFGHEAGAFTGAGESREGLLEHVSGGTLLLDEVCSLSLELQAKLIWLLDTKMVRRLGGLDERVVDVRFLAASSADIEAGITAGTFRADLYFRLRGVEIRLPPLRARKEDIPLLARHFLDAHARHYPESRSCCRHETQPIAIRCRRASGRRVPSPGLPQELPHQSRSRKRSPAFPGSS
jgi:DNA-binding NtrC family response regulator